MKKDLGIPLFYLFSGFSSVDLTRGIFVLFLMAQGFSHAQIGLFQSILFLSILVWEIPSGFFADHFKRKWSLILGMIVLALGYLGVLNFTDFYLVTFAFALKGLGFALGSGASSALLYDHLKSQGPDHPNQFRRVLANSRNIGNLCLAFAIWYGGVLQAQAGWTWTYGLTVLAFMLAAAALFLFSEKRLASEATSPEIPQITSVTRLMLNYLKSTSGKRVLLWVLGLSLLEGAVTPTFIFAQSYFQAHQIEVQTIGIIMAISSLMSSFWYLFVERLRVISLNRMILATGLIVVTIVSSFALPFYPLYHIPAFILAVSLPNLLFVFTDSFLHSQVPSSIRASMISLQSFVNAIAISVGYLTVGLLVDLFDSVIALASLAALPLLMIFGMSFFFRILTEPSDVDIS